MNRILKRDVAFVTIITIGVTGLWAGRSLADPVCVENSGSTKHVCVEWSEQDPPEEDEDFEVNYGCQGCSDAPTVVLMTGDDEWIIYSEVISTQVAANIGAMTTSDEENYVVKIANGANAGAANVSSMVMTPRGDHYSSIASGSIISGNLTGDLTLQETSGGSGGVLSLTIGGNAEGDITAATISTLWIGGNLSGNVDVDEVTGTMTVTDDFLAAYYIEADDISGSLSIGGNAYGYMTLQEFTGSVDVTGDVDFVWFLVAGDGSGDITGGAVTSALVLLAYGEGNAYSGTAEFGSVSVFLNTCPRFGAGDNRETPASVSVTYTEGVSSHSPGLQRSGYPGNVNIGFPVRPHRGRAQRMPKSNDKYVACLL